VIYGRWPILISFGWLLLFAGCVLAQQYFPVIDAVDKGHAVGHERDGVEAVRAALLSGGSVNERNQHGWTPLMEAALQCRAKIVELLLDHAADVNVRGDTTGTKFSDSGQTALLLAAGCFIARRRAQLAPERDMPAAYAGYELAAPVKMVRDLLAHGADPGLADVDGRTPLMMATMQGWADVVQELLRAHAAVNARDREGRLAIDYADLADKSIIVSLKKAGSPKPTGRSGRTVCDAEQELGKAGFDVPIRDCIAGQQLSATVKKFQREHALNVSGELDGPTLKALGVRE
jgi:hypothetical protein